MENNAAQILLGTLLFAICLGIAVVFLDPDYRQAKITESNRGVFTNIPLAADPQGGERSDP